MAGKRGVERTGVHCAAADGGRFLARRPYERAGAVAGGHGWWRASCKRYERGAHAPSRWLRDGAHRRCRRARAGPPHRRRCAGRGRRAQGPAPRQHERPHGGGAGRMVAEGRRHQRGCRKRLRPSVRGDPRVARGGGSPDLANRSVRRYQHLGRALGIPRDCRASWNGGRGSCENARHPLLRPR